MILLQSSLLTLAASQAPTVGDGTALVLGGTPQFTPNGYRADLASEFLGYRQPGHLSPYRGTMEFGYRPEYVSTINRKYSIAGTGGWQAPGSIHLGKHNNSNLNKLFLIAFAGTSGLRCEHTVDAGAFAWTAYQWLTFRIIWDFTVPGGAPNLALWLNGQILPLGGQVSTGMWVVPAPDPNQRIFLGGRGIGVSVPPFGTYRDLVVTD